MVPIRNTPASGEVEKVGVCFVKMEQEAKMVCLRKIHSRPYQGSAGLVYMGALLAALGVPVPLRASVRSLGSALSDCVEVTFCCTAFTFFFFFFSLPPVPSSVCGACFHCERIPFFVSRFLTHPPVSYTHLTLPTILRV